MKSNKLKTIIESYPEYEFLIADGYDDCSIGYDYGMGEPIRLIYSVKKILNKLTKEMIKEGIPEDEAIMDAIEHFEFNMRGGYVGEKTPIWCQDDF